MKDGWGSGANSDTQRAAWLHHSHGSYTPPVTLDVIYSFPCTCSHFCSRTYSTTCSSTTYSYHPLCTTATLDQVFPHFCVIQYQTKTSEYRTHFPRNMDAPQDGIVCHLIKPCSTVIQNELLVPATHLKRTTFSEQQLKERPTRR